MATTTRTGEDQQWAPSRTGAATGSDHHDPASCVDTPRSCATKPANPATKPASNNSSTESTPHTEKVSTSSRRLRVILTNTRNHRITTAVKHRVLRAVDRPLLRLHGARVTAIHCPACNAWVKPRRFLTPAMLCRTCIAATQPPIHRRHGGTP